MTYNAKALECTVSVLMFRVFSFACLELMTVLIRLTDQIKMMPEMIQLPSVSDLEAAKKAAIMFGVFVPNDSKVCHQIQLTLSPIGNSTLQITPIHKRHWYF